MRTNYKTPQEVKAEIKRRNKEIKEQILSNNSRQFLSDIAIHKTYVRCIKTNCLLEVKKIDIRHRARTLEIRFEFSKLMSGKKIMIIL